MIKTIINTNNIDEAEVVLLGAPYEKTASSHKGTINGPKKIIECLNTQLEFFDREFKAEVNDFVKIAHISLNNLENLSPEESYKEIKENTKNLINKNKFVFLLGGEHSVCVGSLEALAEKYDSKEVTILQIDAHCDLRDDDSDYSDTPSKYAHSTVMRRASEMGYNIVQVGIRTYSKEEYEYFSNLANNVKVFEWSKENIPVEEILKTIKTKYLYITIDADGFDPSIMPGTGTPVPGGISWYYGVDLIEKAMNQTELIGVDIVEVSPMPDSVLTEYSAAQLVYTIIANKFSNKLNRN